MQRSVFIGLVIILPLLRATEVSAKSPARPALDTQSQITEAFLRQQRAQWAVQQNRLEGLQILNRKGGIAWKELAEQKQWVSQLRQRLAALERFREFLTTLEKDLSRNSDSIPTASLRFHSAHSARVAAWIRADQTTPSLLAKLALDERDCRMDRAGTSLSVEIQEARKQLERARKTVELASPDEKRFRNTSTLELHQARMTYRLLKAIEDQQHQHASLLFQNSTQRISTPSPSADAMRWARVGTSSATTGSLEFSALTLRGIQLELELAASASNALQRKFTRDRLRKLRGMEKFRAFHLVEIQSTEEELRLRTEQHKADNQRASKLRKEAERLEEIVPMRSLRAVEQQLQLPLQRVARPMIPERLRLRFEQLGAEIRLGDLQAEGDFLKEYLKRLSAVALVQPSAAPDLEWLQYRVKLNQALRDETQRRMTWLAVEQRRLEWHSALLTNGVFSFIQGEERLEPCNANRVQAKEGPTTFPVLAETKEAAAISDQESLSTSLSELRCRVEPACDWNDLRKRMLRSISGPRSSQSRRFRSITAGQSPQIPDRIHGPRARYFRSFQAGRTRDRNLQYQDEYSNGIREPQFYRSPGYAPWYLPGSPANFR